ncbi:ORF6N domain-containing protein [Chryseobacterium sp. R2A-55]|uniref:ORF6N domain-containing protein n=1 Tax=Chryseobacterium sp. R2A-55 TaxID=2744445 RepID=UPI001F2E2151|nr:ORF6N domain-containing protein [Chryseobacterium sp. R2A-55]
MSTEKPISKQHIENRIFTIHGLQVMLDSDLAEMYQVETKTLNRAFKRNIERFPENFCFQISEDEFESLRYQFGTLKTGRGQHRKYLPFVFTEQGVAMLSAVLRSETAVKVSIQIIETFVEMRKLMLNNASLFSRLDKMELKQLENDQKFEQVFKALDEKKLKPESGVFYNGQIFDAYVFVADLVKLANKSIILIDNYIDESVLNLFTKRKKGVTVKILTKQINNTLKQDLAKYNAQYEPIEIETFVDAHDRFLLIDEAELLHIGASLKDLGKKWFAFSKMNAEAGKMIAKLNDLA